ncbi:MAG: GNAT family N-acetyltransferase [Chloroflexota bacterium]
MSPGPFSLPIEPVTLEGRIVRLEPLSRDHLDGLAEVAFDLALWRWTLAGAVDRERLEAWLDAALANRDAGAELPFATIDRASGRPIGSSRYLSIVPEHRRLEIGWTWVARDFQRTGANREAKLLMLEHAMERLGCQRVEFKTNARNEQSRAALLGIGATFEGIFRKHMLGRDGEVRDSAYFSITDDEWPAVKARLAASVEAAVAARS